MKTKLDLHGTKHEDVTRKVIRFVEDNWNSSNEVKVITGHSLIMKKLVVDVLEEYKLEYEAGFYPTSIKVFM